MFENLIIICLLRTNVFENIQIRELQTCIVGTERQLLETASKDLFSHICF